jgi:hypothetical protein
MATTTWTTPIGGNAGGMTYTIITGPNNTTVYTDPIVIKPPDGYVTITALASAALGSNATIKLYGRYTGTDPDDNNNYAALVSNVITGSDLSTIQVGNVNLAAWPAIDYKISVTTTTNDTGKEITIRLLFGKE